MDGHPTPGHAALAFSAAGLGALGAYLEQTLSPLYAAAVPRWPATPDELMAWTKAIVNSVFMAVNCGVGCWQLVAMGRTSYKRRTGGHRSRRKDTPPSGPAPHTDPDGGAKSPE
jgi:hypothetical protein